MSRARTTNVRGCCTLFIKAPIAPIANARERAREREGGGRERERETESEGARKRARACEGCRGGGSEWKHAPFLGGSYKLQSYRRHPQMRILTVHACTCLSGSVVKGYIATCNPPHTHFKARSIAPNSPYPTHPVSNYQNRAFKYVWRGGGMYRGTSLMRNTPHLGPYRRTI